MAYSEYLSDRIRQVLLNKKVIFEEKKMMGGLAIMVNDKMCVGVINNDLMVRIDPDFLEEALTINGCRQMDFTGRPMKSFVQVDPSGIDMDQNLEFWIDKALEFNPRAKSSKQRKK